METRVEDSPECVYLWGKNTHTHTRTHWFYEAALWVVYRQRSALLPVHNCRLLALFSAAGAEALTVQSEVWVHGHVCFCSHPPRGFKARLSMNPRLFNVSSYSGWLRESPAPPHASWGLKRKRHGVVRVTQKVEKEPPPLHELSITGGVNTFHFTRRCSDRRGSAPAWHSDSERSHPLSSLSKNPKQTSYQPIKQANLPHITHLITLPK